MTSWDPTLIGVDSKPPSADASAANSSNGRGRTWFDPGAAELLAEIERQRAQGQSQMPHALARTGSLQEGLREQDAPDLIHALISPEVCRLLVVDRKWRTEKYRHRLATTLAQQLT